jgi:hypothetical protein
MNAATSHGNGPCFRLVSGSTDAFKSEGIVAKSPRAGVDPDQFTHKRDIQNAAYARHLPTNRAE